MSVSEEKLVIQKVESCIEKASVYFNKSFPLPEVYFNQRGKVAGSARLQKNELRFNPTLLNDNMELFLDEVVPHEICHLVAFYLYGRVRPHGKEWQALMIELFNLSPTTYHKMDVSKVRGKHFEYICQCGPVELSIRRHNKVIQGQQKYICRKCRTTLTVRK